MGSGFFVVFLQHVLLGKKIFPPATAGGKTRQSIIVRDYRGRAALLALG